MTPPPNVKNVTLFWRLPLHTYTFAIYKWIYACSFSIVPKSSKIIKSWVSFTKLRAKFNNVVIFCPQKLSWVQVPDDAHLIFSVSLDAFWPQPTIWYDYRPQTRLSLTQAASHQHIPTSKNSFFSPSIWLTRVGDWDPPPYSGANIDIILLCQTSTVTILRQPEANQKFLFAALTSKEQ